MRRLEELEPILDSNTIPLMDRFSARPVFFPTSVWISVLFLVFVVFGYRLLGAWVLLYIPFALGFLGWSLWMVNKFQAKVFVDGDGLIIVSNPPFSPSKKFRYRKRDVERIVREDKYVSFIAESEHQLGYGLSKLELETFYLHLVGWHTGVTV